MRSAIERPYYFDASPTLLAREPAKAPAERKPQANGWPTMYAHLEARLASLRQWRLSWWTSFGEIARYELPRRYHEYIVGNTYDRGLRRDWNIVDSTGTLDGETCAGGMMTAICPPDRPWCSLGPGIPGLELDRAGQIWFDDVSERLRYVQGETNFYDSMSQFFEDMTFFGTGVVLDYESGEDIFVCRNPCAGEYSLAAGADFTDQALYVEERRTVSQIAEMFGLRNCPPDVQQFWQQKGGALDQEFVVGHAIEPNFAIEDQRGGETGRLPGDFTWRETYWLVGKADAYPLSQAGFHEKPFAAARWHTVSNDPYGRGPGSTALGDVIQLQLETRQKAEALEKVIRPPMGADPALQNQPSSQRPGAITYYDTTTGKKGFHPLYEIRPDLPGITADIVDIRNRIGRAFHADLFRMIQEISQSRRDITATEIDALREERLMQLGPVIGRIYKEGIRPRIHRQLAIMDRRGLLPPKPRSLQGVPVQIEFISMLTMAQRASSTASIQQAIALVGNMVPFYPESKDVLDPDEVVREFADLRGTPARIIRAPQDVKKLRAAAAQAQQAAAMGQGAMAAVAGAKQLSDTPLGNGSALDAVVGR